MCWKLHLVLMLLGAYAGLTGHQCSYGCHEYQIVLESHAAIQLYFVIDIVLLAMSLQAHLYGVFVHPRTCSFSLLQETSSVDRAASLLS